MAEKKSTFLENGGIILDNADQLTETELLETYNPDQVSNSQEFLKQRDLIKNI